MEVALAATVLALTLTGMIQVIESGSQMLDVSRKQTIASQILDDELVQLRLQSWATISGYTSFTQPTTVPISSTFASAAESNFTCTQSATVVKTDANGNAAVVFVQYTITWTGISGRTYTRSAFAYIAKNGLSQAYQRS
jgi:hypothetical protein